MHSNVFMEMSFIQWDISLMSLKMSLKIQFNCSMLIPTKSHFITHNDIHWQEALLNFQISSEILHNLN